jgi:serine/threonine-protein kinase
MEFGAAIDALSYLDSMGEDESGLTMGAGNDSVLGHYDYMSAEQAENPHGANLKTDLYSLGCTFYHALTGQVPFPDKNPVRQMLRHANEAPKPLAQFIPEVGDALVGILDRLLAKREQDRFDSATALAGTLALIVPPAPQPPVDEINADFLNWIQSDKSDELKDVGYVPEAEAFMEWLTHTRFDEMDAARAAQSKG